MKCSVSGALKYNFEEDRMFKKTDSRQNVECKSGRWYRVMSAVTVVASALCTLFVPPALAQAAPSPKDGLYLYVCLPGNIAGDLNRGGVGLVVFKVENTGYRFVERIPLPEGPG